LLLDGVRRLRTFYSYGTSCLTAGNPCNGNGGLDCDPACEDGFGALKPLNEEYVLAEVRIERPRPADAKLASRIDVVAATRR